MLTRFASAVTRSARPPLFDLAPGGVCPAASVARHAVRSYRTFSPLPPWPLRAREGGLFSVALSLRLPSAAVSRHRVNMEPGLSSTGCHACRPLGPASPRQIRQRPSGRLVTRDKRAADCNVKCLRSRAGPKIRSAWLPSPVQRPHAHKYYRERFSDRNRTCRFPRIVPVPSSNKNSG